MVLYMMLLPLVSVVVGLIWWALGHAFLESARSAAAILVGGMAGASLLYWRFHRQRRKHY